MTRLAVTGGFDPTADVVLFEGDCLDLLKEQENAKACEEAAIAEAKEKVKALTKQAKDAAKGKEIEDPIYDLTAVNPNRKPKIDTRTPANLFHVIEVKVKEIADALAILRGSDNG